MWNDDDVLRVFGSMFSKGDRFKAMEMPAAQYATCPYDLVSLNGRRVGLSNFPAYSSILVDGSRSEWSMKVRQPMGRHWR